MGRRKRKHKQDVAAGTEKPFRASPDKPKRGEPSISGKKELSKAMEILERVRRLKGG